MPDRRPSRFGQYARRALAGLVAAFVATAVAATFSRTSLGERFENNTYDQRVRAAAPPPVADSPIVIVEIDDASIRAMEPIVGRWSWPRLVHSSAIDFLTQAGARVIAYDVLFTEREGRSDVVVNGHPITSEASDGAFVDSVRKSGRVILLADATGELTANDSGAGQDAVDLPGTTYHPGPGFEARPRLDLPFPDLAAASAGVGHNALPKDDSDSARRIRPFVEVHGQQVPSLGVAAALAFLKTPAANVALRGRDLAIGDTVVPLLDDPIVDANGVSHPSRQMLFRLNQPLPNSSSMFPTYSFFDVVLAADELAGGRKPNLSPALFKDKLVFIGTTAAGLYDRYSAPFGGGLAGVEIHATVADNILRRSFMRRASFVSDVSGSFGLALLSGLAATTLPLGLAAGLVLAFTLGVIAWLTHEVGAGFWLSAVMPVAAAALALFSGVAWRYFVEDREKRHLRLLFGRYVSGDVIEQLLADPALARLGGQRRDMTVLFSDIRGFTTKSEEGRPEAVVAQLNEYFGAMVEVLFRHRGTLDKFVGDMVMGLFGAPLPDPAHADHAVAAALEMMERLQGLNERWQAAGQPTLDIGIGINSGEMIAGNIGSEAIMSYTVIGDAVNLGSRLESLNKDYGTHVLISDETRSRLTTAVPTRLIGEVKVKGRSQAVRVFEVAGRTVAQEETQS